MKHLQKYIQTLQELLQIPFANANSTAVIGARHEWHDTSGNKRLKIGTQTSATDCVIISANAGV
jgi:hypothetical protein